MLPVFASGIYKRCYGHHKRDKSYKKICLNFRAQKRRVECSFGIICPCPPCKRNIFFGTSNNRKNDYRPNNYFPVRRRKHGGFFAEQSTNNIQQKRESAKNQNCRCV